MAMTPLATKIQPLRTLVGVLVIPAVGVKVQLNRRSSRS